MSEWISAKSKKPSKNEHVIFIASNKKGFYHNVMALGIYLGKGMFHIDWTDILVHASLWMTSPINPKE
jgi:hypothetical protein